jgi:hypothetical protein
MSKFKLLHNDQVNWSHANYYYDENGQAHAQHLHWGDDYTLEDGSTIDDMDAVSDGFILREIDEDYDYDEEWN